LLKISLSHIFNLKDITDKNYTWEKTDRNIILKDVYINFDVTGNRGNDQQLTSTATN